MPLVRRLPLLLLLTACPGSDDGTDGDAAAFCEEMASSNEGCWSEELDQDCLDRYAECGEQITVMESCPVQLGC